MLKFLCKLVNLTRSYKGTFFSEHSVEYPQLRLHQPLKHNFFLRPLTSTFEFHLDGVIKINLHAKYLGQRSPGHLVQRLSSGTQTQLTALLGSVKWLANIGNCAQVFFTVMCTDFSDCVQTVCQCTSANIQSSVEKVVIYQAALQYSMRPVATDRVPWLSLIHI